MTAKDPIELTWKEACVAAAGFLLLSVLFCYPAGFSSEIILLGDTETQFFGYMQRAFHPISPQVAGPWDPTQITGLPESHVQHGLYYPVTWLLFRLFPLVQAFGLGMLLHHALAGLGTYLLVRRAPLSRLAGWLAGIVWAFGGFLVFHRGHPEIQQAGAWLPWVLWAFESYRRGGGWHWVLVAGTFLSLHGVAGHVGVVALCGTVWVAYLLFHAWAGPGENLGRVRFVSGISAACVLGALGSMPQILPLLEVSRWSAYREFDLDFFREGNLKARFFVGLISPWFLQHGNARPSGYWGLTEMGIFQGILALGFAGAGLLGRRNADRETSRQCRFWLVLLLVNVALMLGENLGLHQVMRWVPVYNLFHISARHALIFGLALAWWAAVGCDALRRVGSTFLHENSSGDGAASTDSRRLLFRASIMLVVLVGIAGSLCMPGWPTRAPGLNYLPYWIAAGTGLLALLLMSLVASSRARRVGLLALVPLLAFAEVWCHLHHLGLGKAELSHLTDPNAFPEPIRWLREQQGDDRPIRYLAQRSLLPHGKTSHVNYAPSQGLTTMDTYCQGLPATLGQLLHLTRWGGCDFSRVLAEERGLSATGGRYILTDGQPLPVAPGRGYLVARTQDLDWQLNQCREDPRVPFLLTSTGRDTSHWETKWPRDHPGSCFVDGELVRHGAATGFVHVRATVGPVKKPVVLAEARLSADEFRDGRAKFGLLFERGPGEGELRVQLSAEGMEGVELGRLDLWRIDRAVVERGRHDIDELRRLLREGTRELYAPVKSFGDCLIHVNNRARDLATLVRETRTATTPQQAAENILHADLPVRELAYVVAGAEEGSPARFSPGEVRLTSTVADDIRLETHTAGPGFLVLTVTRCLGWSATVDDEPAVIQAVDGPLMGVHVPAGEHRVRFHYRPLLVWWGAAMAFAALGGGWALWLMWRVLSVSKPSSSSRGTSLGAPRVAA